MDELRAFLAAIVESSDDAIIGLTPQGRIFRTVARGRSTDTLITRSLANRFRCCRYRSEVMKSTI